MPSGSKGSLGGRRGKNVSLPSSRIVISSEAEKSSLQTAQRCVLENGKTLHQGIVSAKRHVGCIPLCKKDPSTALGMTIRGMRYPHPTSAPSGHLLPEEGGSIHASPFLWKGRGAQRGGVGFLFCGEAASSLPSPMRKAACSSYRHGQAFPLQGQAKEAQGVSCASWHAILQS